MDSRVPEQLLTEQNAVEAEIRAVFKGVTRVGGTSWNEGWAIDVYRSEEQLAAARAMDREKSWEELVDDPNWNANSMGPWAFLDAIGIRYYMAPAMIRDVRNGWADDGLMWTLEYPIYEPELSGLLTPPQSAALDRYFRFLIAVEDADPSSQQPDPRFIAGEDGDTGGIRDYFISLLRAQQRWKT